MIDDTVYNSRGRELEAVKKIAATHFTDTALPTATEIWRQSGVNHKQVPTNVIAQTLVSATINTVRQQADIQGPTDDDLPAEPTFTSEWTEHVARLWETGHEPSTSSLDGKETTTIPKREGAGEGDGGDWTESANQRIEAWIHRGDPTVKDLLQIVSNTLLIQDPTEETIPEKPPAVRQESDLSFQTEQSSNSSPAF